MADIERFRSIIEERLRELRARMQTIETELDQPKPKDLEEQAIDLEDDEVMERLGLSAQREVREMQEALGRMSNGSFGICAECGEPISTARLEAVPHARLCKTCAANAEKR